MSDKLMNKVETTMDVYFNEVHQLNESPSEAGYSGSGKYKYKIYHDSMHNAFEEVKRYVDLHGYTVDEESLSEEWNRGGTWSDIHHYDEGQTKRYSIALNKNNQATNKKIQVQIYHMGYMNDSNDFLELNMYLS